MIVYISINITIVKNDHNNNIWYLRITCHTYFERMVMTQKSVVHPNSHRRLGEVSYLLLHFQKDKICRWRDLEFVDNSEEQEANETWKTGVCSPWMSLDAVCVKYINDRGQKVFETTFSAFDKSRVLPAS